MVKRIGFYPATFCLVVLMSPCLLSANGLRVDDPAKHVSGNLAPVHFVLDSNLNTGNNSTIVLPSSVADTVIDPGDEIGVFTGSGVLCGAAGYAGSNLAITVWGDDPATGAAVEGMQPDSAYYFRLWDASQQKESIAFAIFQSGVNAYEPDAIEVIQHLAFCNTSDTLIIVTACASYTLNNQTYDSSGVYTQLLTNFIGCDSMVTLNLTIDSIPVVLANNDTICAGQEAVLSASGAEFYFWSTGATADTLVVNPDTTTSYTVTGVTAGCISTPTTVQVLVIPLPTVSLGVDTIVIYTGET